MPDAGAIDITVDIRLIPVNKMMEAVMGVKEIPGYICLGGVVIVFVAMYLIPAIGNIFMNSP